MAHTQHKKPNIETSDINLSRVLGLGLVLALAVVAAFAITVYLFDFLTSLERSRKKYEYLLVANEVKNEELRAFNSVIEDAQRDALTRLKKEKLVGAKTQEELKEKEEALKNDKEYQEKREQIESMFKARQDNRIFTIGFLRPAFPGPAYEKADTDLLKQGLDKNASNAAAANGNKGKIVVSRLEGIDPLRPMMSGVPGWPSYAHVTLAVSEDLLKRQNINDGIKSFVSKYKEKNKEFHEKNKFQKNSLNDQIPSDSSSGIRPMGNDR